MFGTNGLEISNYSPTTGVSYHQNWDFLANVLIPSWYAKWSETKEYIMSHTQPIKEFYYELVKYRKNLIFHTKHVTSQTYVLRKYLRDYYNNQLIDIINNTAIYDSLYLFNKTEQGDNSDVNKTHLYNRDEIILESEQVYLYTRQELFDKDNFIIKVPFALLDLYGKDEFYYKVKPYIPFGITYRVEGY